MNEKVLSLLFLMSSCFIQSTGQLVDELGRTPLMNFVIAKESEILMIKTEVDRLWDSCYYYKQEFDGVIQMSNGCAVNTYKSVVTRRASCTDEDINIHRKAKELSQSFMQDTIDQMRLMEQSEKFMIAAQDYSGKTVLNYCYSEEIYNELMRQGVPFQYTVWCYFNPRKTTLLAITTLVATCIGTIVIVNSL